MSNVTDFCALPRTGKNLDSKYGQKLLETTQKLTDTLKTASKNAIHEMAKATSYLDGNKIAEKISKSTCKNQFNLRRLHK